MRWRRWGRAAVGRTLLKLNHVAGFDCPSCAWPDRDPKHRKTAEFCENGAKAVAWEATRTRAGAAFFAAYPVAEQREQDDHWLESNGRLTEPAYLAPGPAHYVPISGDDELQLAADRLRALGYGSQITSRSETGLPGRFRVDLHTV